jgi:hypothetical protein
MVISDLSQRRSTPAFRRDKRFDSNQPLDRKVSAIFGDTISAVERNGNEVRVSYEQAPTEGFDLALSSLGGGKGNARGAEGVGPSHREQRNG